MMRLSNDNSRRCLCVVTVLAMAALMGCGSNKTIAVVPSPLTPTGLPTPAAAGPVNTYVGARSPGAWTLTLDNTKNSYSYQALTFPSASNGTNLGSLTMLNGFARLGASGYALEVRGRAAILRPGDTSAAPVFAVPQTQCYTVTGRIRFQYIGMQTGPDGAVGGAGPTLGYGSIVASTDATGKSWQFQSLQGNIVAGPGDSSGTCNTTGSNAAIKLSGQTVLNDLWPPNDSLQLLATNTTESNVWIGPSGFFVADQSDTAITSPTGASAAGVAEPSSPLKTSDLASQTYIGFLYEPPTTPYGGVAPSNAFTAPVAFGPGTLSASALSGGMFPNDDVTQTPNSDIAVDLGKQDATFNGLYTAVSITVLDPNQNCANYTGSGEKATSGINAQGYFTCTYAGIAIAGKPEGKYALFISSYNWAAQLGGAPMQIYLFQQ